MTFSCTIVQERYLGSLCDRMSNLAATTVQLVGRITLRARNPRQAAARAYVKCVGQQRARLLKQAPEMPPQVIDCETDPRAIAPGLVRKSHGPGNCYSFDNLMEIWHIHVRSRRTSPARCRRRTLQSLRSPSLN